MTTIADHYIAPPRHPPRKNAMQAIRHGQQVAPVKNRWYATITPDFGFTQQHPIERELRKQDHHATLGRILKMGFVYVEMQRAEGDNDGPDKPKPSKSTARNHFGTLPALAWKITGIYSTCEPVATRLEAMGYTCTLVDIYQQSLEVAPYCGYLLQHSRKTRVPAHSPIEDTGTLKEDSFPYFDKVNFLLAVRWAEQEKKYGTGESSTRAMARFVADTGEDTGATVKNAREAMVAVIQENARDFFGGWTAGITTEDDNKTGADKNKANAMQLLFPHGLCADPPQTGLANPETPRRFVAAVPPVQPDKDVWSLVWNGVLQYVTEATVGPLEGLFGVIPGQNFFGNIWKKIGSWKIAAVTAGFLLIDFELMNKELTTFAGTEGAYELDALNELVKSAASWQDSVRSKASILNLISPKNSSSALVSEANLESVKTFFRDRGEGLVNWTPPQVDPSLVDNRLDCTRGGEDTEQTCQSIALYRHQNKTSLTMETMELWSQIFYRKAAGQTQSFVQRQLKDSFGKLSQEQQNMVNALELAPLHFSTQIRTILANFANDWDLWDSLGYFHKQYTDRYTKAALTPLGFANLAAPITGGWAANVYSWLQDTRPNGDGGFSKEPIQLDTFKDSYCTYEFIHELTTLSTEDTEELGSADYREAVQESLIQGVINACAKSVVDAHTQPIFENNTATKLHIYQLSAYMAACRLAPLIKTLAETDVAQRHIALPKSEKKEFIVSGARYEYIVIDALQGPQEATYLTEQKLIEFRGNLNRLFQRYKQDFGTINYPEWLTTLTSVVEDFQSLDQFANDPPTAQDTDRTARERKKIEFQQKGSVMSIEDLEEHRILAHNNTLAGFLTATLAGLRNAQILAPEIIGHDANMSPGIETAAAVALAAGGDAKKRPADWNEEEVEIQKLTENVSQDFGHFKKVLQVPAPEIDLSGGEDLDRNIISSLIDIETRINQAFTTGGEVDVDAKNNFINGFSHHALARQNVSEADVVPTFMSLELANFMAFQQVALRRKLPAKLKLSDRHLMKVLRAYDGSTATSTQKSVDDRDPMTYFTTPAHREVFTYLQKFVEEFEGLSPKRRKQFLGILQNTGFVNFDNQTNATNAERMRDILRHGPSLLTFVETNFSAPPPGIYWMPTILTYLVYYAIKWNGVYYGENKEETNKLYTIYMQYYCSTAAFSNLCTLGTIYYKGITHGPTIPTDIEEALNFIIQSIAFATLKHVGKLVTEVLRYNRAGPTQLVGLSLSEGVDFWALAGSFADPKGYEREGNAQRDWLRHFIRKTFEGQICVWWVFELTEDDANAIQQLSHHSQVKWVNAESGTPVAAKGAKIKLSQDHMLELLEATLNLRPVGSVNRIDVVQTGINPDLHTRPNIMRQEAMRGLVAKFSNDSPRNISVADDTNLNEYSDPAEAAPKLALIRTHASAEQRRIAEKQFAALQHPPIWDFMKKKLSRMRDEKKALVVAITFVGKLSFYAITASVAIQPKHSVLRASRFTGFEPIAERIFETVEGIFQGGETKPTELLGQTVALLVNCCFAAVFKVGQYRLINWCVPEIIEIRFSGVPKRVREITAWIIVLFVAGYFVFDVEDIPERHLYMFAGQIARQLGINVNAIPAKGATGAPDARSAIYAVKQAARQFLIVYCQTLGVSRARSSEILVLSQLMIGRRNPSKRAFQIASHLLFEIARKNNLLVVGREVPWAVDYGPDVHVDPYQKWLHQVAPATSVPQEFRQSAEGEEL